MALALTNMVAPAGNLNISAGGTNATASFTTTTGNYYLFALAASGTCSAPTRTGVSFSLLVSSGSTYVYGGYCSSGSTATATFTNTNSNTTMAWCVDELSGVTAPTSPVVQSKLTAGATSSLASLIKSSNATYSVGCMSSPSLGTATQPSGYTVLGARGGNGSQAIETAYENPGAAAAAWAAGSGNSMNFVATFELGFPLDSFGTAPAVNSMMMMGRGV